MITIGTLADALREVGPDRYYVGDEEFGRISVIAERGDRYRSAILDPGAFGRRSADEVARWLSERMAEAFGDG